MNEGEEPTPIVADGNDSDAPQSNDTMRFFKGVRHYRGASKSQRYQTLSDLANNPNTPEFFSDAMKANTTQKPRKRNLGLIIAVVVVLVVAIIIGLVLIITSKKAQDESADNKFGTHTIIEAANLFGNYLLFGTDTKDQLPDSITINAYTTYKIAYMDASDSGEEKQQNFKKLSDYYWNFRHFYDKADKSKYDLAQSDAVAWLGDAIDFLKTYDEYNLKTDVDTYAYYSRNGAESTERYLANVFEKYTNTSNNIINQYYTQKQTAAELLKDYAKVIEGAGCIDNEDPEMCLFDKTKKGYEIRMDSAQSPQEIEDNMEDFHSNIVSTLTINTFDIVREISGEEATKWCDDLEK